MRSTKPWQCPGNPQCKNWQTVECKHLTQRVGTVERGIPDDGMPAERQANKIYDFERKNKNDRRRFEDVLDSLDFNRRQGIHRVGGKWTNPENQWFADDFEYPEANPLFPKHLKVYKLNKLEQEILIAKLSEGKTIIEISRAKEISESTVKRALKSAKDKIQLLRGK